MLEIMKEDIDKEMMESMADDHANQVGMRKTTGPSERCWMLREPPKLRWRRTSKIWNKRCKTQEVQE